MFLYCYLKNNRRNNLTQVDYFYKLSCALFQASIIVWKIKYDLQDPRPIQIIRGSQISLPIKYYLVSNKKLVGFLISFR
jgi:hypothetical protein